MPTSTPTRSRISLIASALVVIVCLALGGAFVWWTVKETGGSATVKLSSSDLETLQNAGRKMQYQASAGIPLDVNQGGPGQPRRTPLRVRQPGAQADSITGNDNATTIFAGTVLVHVARSGNPPAIVFRERVWGELQDRPVFTIARRIVHEETLAKQLAVSQEQLRQLTAIVATPALKGGYISALPVSGDDLDHARKAWTEFSAALPAANASHTAGPLQANLFKAMRQIGASAISKAQQEYADAAKAINTVLTPRQVQAYRQGKSLRAGNLTDYQNKIGLPSLRRIT